MTPLLQACPPGCCFQGLHPQSSSPTAIILTLPLTETLYPGQPRVLPWVQHLPLNTHQTHMLQPNSLLASPHSSALYFLTQGSHNPRGHLPASSLWSSYCGPCYCPHCPFTGHSSFPTWPIQWPLSRSPCPWPLPHPGRLSQCI